MLQPLLQRNRQSVFFIASEYSLDVTTLKFLCWMTSRSPKQSKFALVFFGCMWAIISCSFDLKAKNAHQQSRHVVLPPIQASEWTLRRILVYVVVNVIDHFACLKHLVQRPCFCRFLEFSQPSATTTQHHEKSKIEQRQSGCKSQLPSDDAIVAHFPGWIRFVKFYISKKCSPNLNKIRVEL